MQAGGKGDEAGWGVYEESRRGGAMVATAHEHSYSRTHLLSSMSSQAVAYPGSPLVLWEDDPRTVPDEGRSFVFVSGLGGRSIRDQEVSGAWFASILASDQGAQFGALFCSFGPRGSSLEADCYFRDITGRTADTFTVRSLVSQRCGLLGIEGLPLGIF